jgi:hypothetical protein
MLLPVLQLIIDAGELGRGADHDVPCLIAEEVDIVKEGVLLLSVFGWCVARLDIEGI